MNHFKVVNSFKQKFEGKPLVARSPGRINIIGEHTDYNDGFVLPAAVDKDIVIALASNGTDKFNIVSLDMDSSVSFTLNAYDQIKEDWAQYIIGVIDLIIKNGKSLQGFDCVFGGDIPVGAGMSSSAALECGMAYGLNELYQLGLNKLEIVKIAQKAENEYVGVNCGIMDQFANTFSEENKVIKLDCRDLTYELFPLNPTGYSLVLLDTQVKHSLASSEYNTRRMECEKGVKVISASNPDISSLRDVTLDLLAQFKDQLSPNVYKRCKYVVEENQRVEEVCDALQKDNYQRVGELMFSTHHGLSQEYEVSCEELDFLANYAQNTDGVDGARMMGGGFGGCTINLVRENRRDDFVAAAAHAYHQKFGVELKSYPVKIADGTSIID